MTSMGYADFDWGQCSESVHSVSLLPPDFSGEHRAKPVPPEPDRLVADIDAALVQQILDIAQRERKANVQHHRQSDDLG